jgi:adenylosuccinate synthase
MKVTALVGAQFGSEGKGVVAKHIANEYDAWVRTGGPNAGHSFVEKGRLWKMQCLPCGWVNKNAMLMLGPGAVINPDILLHEIEQIENGYDPNIRGRILIDARATPLLQKHVNREGHTKGEIHERIGSTGEGVGAARMEWMNRDERAVRPFAEIAENYGHGFAAMVGDTTEMLSGMRRRGKSIMLEGTQGFGLSLTHGQWPYVTSADTNAAQLASDAGVPPQHVTDVYLVARTYPIRVAGNSGPLHEETNWQAMSHRLKQPVEERTTVTKLIRRVGAWDEELMARACIVNSPTGIILTFIDYLSPDDQWKTMFINLTDKSRSFVDYIERRFEAPVILIGTGFSPAEGWTCIDRR